MIERLTISGVHMHVDNDLQKYITRKIGRLDRFVPRHERESLHVDVWLKEDKQDRTCEVVMRLPGNTIKLEETTVNMFAAIDIAETKLRIALKKYKMTHANPRFHQRMLVRFKHRGAA